MFKKALTLVVFILFCLPAFAEKTNIEIIKEAEKVLNLTPQGSLTDRINLIEKKLVGATYYDSISIRCKRIDEYLDYNEPEETLTTIPYIPPVTNATNQTHQTTQANQITQTHKTPNTYYTSKYGDPYGDDKPKDNKLVLPFDNAEIKDNLNVEPEPKQVINKNNLCKLNYNYQEAYGDYFNDPSQISFKQMKWDHCPLKVSFASVPADYKLDVFSSITKWGKFFPLEITENNNADIIFEWVPKSTLRALHPSKRVIGLAHHGIVGDKHVCKILILDRKKYPKTQLESIIMHEMGHALGLGHSPYQQDIMFETNSAQKGGVSRWMFSNIGYIPIILPIGIRGAKKATLLISPRDANTLLKIYNTTQ